jgi:hypothetical protein
MYQSQDGGERNSLFAELLAAQPKCSSFSAIASKYRSAFKLLSPNGYDRNKVNSMFSLNSLTAGSDAQKPGCADAVETVDFSGA